ncbi:hypothetical protein DFH07DRAFT_857449 [Mycena maculata]|uniref:Uncharacterized protein n=1 Tax=Mycena maculata TaxID=230809 RepID=A0AAD7HIU1_9AGAR|nr:hypothetical protein DFH07DRAFT_857449 [Mycena maculata]
MSIETEGQPVVASCPSSQNRDVEDGEILDLPSTAGSVLSVDSQKYTTSAPQPLAPSSGPDGLHSMTAEDLEHAKDIVLDLLGWGVEPEYLVECGVSAGTIRRIFTDLRLRLPKNL